MNISEIRELINKAIPQAVIGEDEKSSPKALIIEPGFLKDVCKLLFSNEKTYFDMLSCITGIDNGVEINTMEVAYNLYSIPFDVHLMLKVELPREQPQIDSVTEIWKTADWQEREAYDLLGIDFIGHPDLRRILLPADWEGHPLKKDYKHQKYYRGIKVEY
ncbi:NADH-quinone oxidoreductase subunit C [Fulvivirga sp. RKSG066]|uniref:NADH-quinone oxidoreductase subunit C n=1 Tax=Fulvivirga aurantia TaxID=2529383 RepID=UPI0012BC761F|nr:NADH-quinone oxidoreductase subunit C [Fulvivirga aurantia]MTI23023.1 NADH-quinone oxidoreductase subunit C [Fulvivirga aurantia]